MGDVNDMIPAFTCACVFKLSSFSLVGEGEGEGERDTVKGGVWL
jgi:hypothetical protein